MSEQTKEIKKLADWCQKARTILGAGMKGDSRKMEQQIDQVAAMLKKLSKQTGDADKLLFEAGMNSYRMLSEQHQALNLAHNEAVTAKDKAKKGSKEREQAELAVGQAREKIRALMLKMSALKDGLIADAPLAKAVHFFEVSVRNAENQIKDELTRGHSNAVLLNGALKTLGVWKTNVGTQDKYQVPAEVEDLTSQIKPLLNSLIGNSTKTSGEKRKGDEKQSLARGAAEQRLKEVKALLRELTSSGQLAKTIEDELNLGIREAESLNTQEMWIEGAARLKPLPDRKQCLKVYEEVRQAAAVDFGREVEQTSRTLVELKEQVDVATWKRFDVADKLLLGRAGATLRKPKDNALLLKDFREHIGQMKTAVQSAIETEGRLKSLLVTLTQSAQGLVPVVPLNRVDENLRQLELIKLLQGERRWQEAEVTAQLLQSSMKAQSNADFDKWKRAGPELRGRPMLNDLRMAIGNPGATPALKAAAQRLINSIAEPRLAMLEAQRDWSGLMALHGDASKFVVGLAGEIKTFKDFAGGRAEADEAVQLRLARGVSALSELERALTEAGADPAPVLKPLNDRLKELTDGWQARLKSAGDATALNQPLMEQDLNLLMQAILSANYGNNLEETAGSQRDAAGKALFDKALAALERDSLGPLELLSVSMAGELRDEVAALSLDTARETDPAQPWAQRVLALQAIGVRATTGITEAGKACTDLNRELVGKAENVALLLSAAKEELKSKGIWGSVASRYEPMFVPLELELAGLRELLTTTNATAAQGNRKLLENLKKRADDLVKLVTHNKGVDGREERVENAAKRLETLRKDGLDKLAPETNGSLGELLKALRRDMFGMEPQVMNQALDEVDVALVGARTELDGVLAQKARVAELELNLRPRIAKMKQSNVAVAYYDKLLERVSAAVEQAKKLPKLFDALVALDGIANEVTQAEADPNAALSRQKVQNSEEDAQKRLKAEYKGRLETVTARIVPRATRAVETAGGDPGQIEEVARMIKQAEKAGEGGNYESAIQTLVRTENRIVEIEKNPAGTALGDRKALPKHVETFAAQMNALRDQLGLFVEAAVAKAPEASREPLGRSLNSAVDKVKTQLNPRMFDLYIGDITNTGKPIADRRAVRDQALQRLREMQAFLSKHPTVVKLASNPILPLLGPLRLADSGLTRLEAHLRMAVR